MAKERVAHILIWLYHKITSNEIDDVICAEIPHADVDKDLYVVTKNMLHGPCGTLNPKSSFMIDGKCSKQYPRALISNTITGNDGYHSYRRRSVEDGGKLATIRISNGDIETEGSNRNAVSHIDEIAQYQAGRYISSNEAVWRILSFPMHERSPAVVHIAVPLENGQACRGNFVVAIFLGLIMVKQVDSRKNLFVRNSNSKCNNNGKGNNDSKGKKNSCKKK
ncbi:unnamed protein product [Onchocerca ochengi]|uniref:AMP-binding domain-containing protein n=1 Tax=Onchocerca ochengi TaxID=42157 RepID=A0A182EX16_ONCOC|nr:unnamed protein product [Onchocerca ochengi]